MEIIKALTLNVGDRFALSDWSKDPRNRIVFVVGVASDKRETIDAVAGDGRKIRVHKEDYVFKLTKL